MSCKRLFSKCQETPSAAIEFCYSKFLGHTGLLTTFSILVATEHPPPRATPHRRVLPVTLLADETALLLGETHEFLVLLALFEQLQALVMQAFDL